MSASNTSTDKETGAANHLVWIDILRVFSIFQVILIHTSFPIFYKEELPHSYWAAANFYDAFSRAGVPIFFMISGYLLLERSELSLDFFKRRFIKVGIPAVVWTAAYLIWQQQAYRNGSMNLLHIGLSMIKAVFGGHIELHLWFVYVLLGLYLVMPILHVLVSASPSVTKYFVVLWLIANPFLGLLPRISGEPVDVSLRLLLVEGYSGFLVLGYLLKPVVLTKRGGLISLISFLVMGFAMYLGTDVLSQKAGSLDGFLYWYLGFPVIVMSVSLFLWFKSWGESLTLKHTSWIRQVSDTTFGIYLIHIFMLEILRKGWLGFSLYSWMGPSSYAIPLTAFAAFVLSFLVIFTMKRIPVLRHVV